MSAQFVSPTVKRVRRSFVLGVVLLLAAAGGWVFVDAHAPTLGNAVTSSWVLKPRAYDLLRFGCAALAILGGASLLQALLTALLHSERPPALAPTDGERSPALLASPPAAKRWHGTAGLLLLGAALAIGGVAVTAAINSDGSRELSDAAPEQQAPPVDVVEPAQIYFTAGETQGNARLAVNAMESCYTDTQTYGRCDSSAEIVPYLGDLPLADEPGPGEVSLHGAGDTFSITAGDSDGQLWSVNKSSAGTVERTCLVAVEFTPCATPTW